MGLTLRAQSSFAAPVFGDPRFYPTGTSPVAVVSGEFDSRPGVDLATANEANTLTLLRNLGNGVFVPGASLDLPDRFTPTHMDTGDFNGDGIDDLAITADDLESFPSFLGSVVVFSSDGPFSYEMEALQTGLFPTCVLTADLVPGPFLDLAVCATDSNGGGLVPVLSGNDRGSFGLFREIATGAIVPTRLSYVDVDGDSFEDLLVVDENGDTIWMLPGNGSAALFGSPVPLAEAPLPADATIAQLVPGGLPELAVVSRLDNRLIVYRQVSPGVFGVTDVHSTGLLPIRVVAEDFDGDFLPDLLVLSNGSSQVQLFLNAGDGSFELGEQVAVGSGPVDITVADFNSDGKPDFATANQDDESFGRDTQSVSVALNGESPPLTPTQTGTPTVTATPTSTPTVTRTPTASATPTPAGPADGNCDGVIDGADLELVVHAIFGRAAPCLVPPVRANFLVLVIRSLGEPL
ncbi:MAG: hypothetical protein KatS3mg076_1243 [Candidatus Binatia bacterium]|nr:MAG: hypothetical protein KatS3mg076_1243 [Candidatus Binatia bacterium]